MLFLTKYTSSATNDRSPEAMKAALATFGEVGPAPGQIAHYVAADGSAGYVISERDSIEEAYEQILRYLPWFDFEINPVLDVEDALPIMMKVLG